MNLIKNNIPAEEIIEAALRLRIPLSQILPSASYWGHADLVGMLLQRGISPWTEGRSGAPAVVYALQWGDAATVREFQQVLPAGTIINAPWIKATGVDKEISMVGTIEVLLRKAQRILGCY